MAEVIGLKKIDYVNKSNERVVGLEMHMQKPLQDGEGFEVSKCYLPFSQFPDVCNNVSIGSNVMVSFNRWNRVDECIIL